MARVSLLDQLPPAFSTEVFPALLLLGIGWLVRRRMGFGAEATRAVSRIVVDTCFPALAFLGILRTVAAGGLGAGAWALGLAAVLFALSAATGLAAARLVARPRRPTVAFLVAMPNWIFLPLPIAPALWGPPAAGTVLWINLAMQLLIWSAGIALLQARPGGRGGPGRLRLVLGNPAFLASLAGIGAGLLWPGLAAMTAPSFGTSDPATWLLTILLRGIGLLAQLTIPLSFIVMGAQLAGAKIHPREWGRALGVTVFARLLVAPLLFALVVRFVPWEALGAAPWVAPTSLLVMAMPCAITCGSIIERFGGDEDLTAQAVLASTLASPLTVALVLALGTR